MHRGFFLPVKAFPPAPNGPGTGGGRCHATYLCGERFNSRPPWGERPDGAYTGGTDARISIHALREEGDGKSGKFLLTNRYFNPRPPRGGRLCINTSIALRMQISIHALREEGDHGCAAWAAVCLGNFNPRPPRGGRLAQACQHTDLPDISIHALREEGDCSFPTMPKRFRGFQSTPSARRATMP